MRLNVSNFFSGNYNVDGRVWEESYPDQKLPISSTVLRALTADQCYLYAGNVTDSDEDRAGYSLTVKVDKNSYEDSVNDETGAEIRKYTVVTIGSKNADKNIKDESNGKSWVEVSRTADPVNNNLENVVTKVYLHYSYMNLRDAEYPVKMIFEGTLTRSVLISEQKKKLLLIDRKQHKKGSCLFLRGSFLYTCATPLAQLCQFVGTAMPSAWHSRAKGVARTWHYILYP